GAMETGRADKEALLATRAARLDHVRGELEMQVEQRHVEGRDATRTLETGIAPRRDQVARALDTALPRGIEQGRETAFVHVFGARLGDDLAFPLADDAARIHVGTR